MLLYCVQFPHYIWVGDDFTSPEGANLSEASDDNLLEWVCGVRARVMQHHRLCKTRIRP